MNNEPVAWLLFRDGGESYPEYTTSYKQMREWETYLGDNERIEPHYTHPANLKYDPETGEPLIDGYPLFSGLPPAKTLTDEEIKQLQRECIADAYAQAHFHGDKYINSQQAILNFARAILRKAQKK